MIREKLNSYNAIFDVEKCNLRAKNLYFWAFNFKIQILNLIRQEQVNTNLNELFQKEMPRKE